MDRRKGIAKHCGSGQTRVDALRSIDRRVGAGEMVGPSVSGKTTPLNVIEPSKGQVSLDHKLIFDNQRPCSDLLLHKIGFVFLTEKPAIDAPGLVWSGADTILCMT